MDQSLPTAGTYVCHGITWATTRPCLLLAPVPGGSLRYAAVMSGRLSYQVTGTGRWCTGRYRFAGHFRVEAVACPDRSPTERGGQCVSCTAQDDFRFAHQFHSGGHVPESLATYMTQPHRLYLATFGDGTTKVGTAAVPRGRSRLDEQGALVATYLAEFPDGRTVRFAEDALTRRLGLTQTVRGTVKLRALAELRGLAQVRAAHEHHLDQAARTLADMGIPVHPEPWSPPAEGDLLRSTGGAKALYPHDPRQGEHGFSVLSCIGSQALITLGRDDLPYLIDLGVLKGHRITLSPGFASPVTTVQSTLF
ncbi:DUF2797 domain-containing protein [Streptomyces sp. NPDC093249]|uniref:DUF2797 domain-containing protein n=1 Tax=unclassified Streptomyces TaxID=2593676 RepID=UPI00344F4787